MKAELPLALGSASPRRRDILTDLGLPFFVCPASIDETPLLRERPGAYLERIAAAKLLAVTERLTGAAASESGSRLPFADHCAVLVADTTVVLDGEILGKPANTAEAFDSVRRLCGRRHQVFTRYGLSVAAYGPGSPEPQYAQPLFRTVESHVELVAATDAQIKHYAQTGEGLDKAGAYAVQGIGAFLVKSLTGSYSNVVGLPAAELIEDLRQVGLFEAFPHIEGAPPRSSAT